MVEVYLARHGQTEENVCRIFQGHLPGRLTDEGKLQAIALGEYLKDIPLDGILSSDLDRVVETVRLAVGSRHLPWQITPLLREINWGSWTGLPIDSVDKSCYPEMRKHVKCFTIGQNSAWILFVGIIKILVCLL